MATVYTPEVHRAIVESVRGGNYVETAAACAGIHRQRVYEWIARGEADGAVEPYLSFALDIRKAMAEAEADAVGVLKAAQYEDWKAAEVYLRRGPASKRWGDRQELSGSVDVTVSAAHEDVLGKLARLAASAGTGTADPKPDPDGS